MKKPRKIAFETWLWFGLILVACFLSGGCQTAKQNYSFSPLPSDPSIFGDPPPSSYRRITITNASDMRIYYVGGQVKSPGRQLYLSPMTVTKAIQSAGDFTDFAARTRVELTRASGQKIEVNCTKAAKDPASDSPVYPGDKIVVPMRNLWDSVRW